MQIELDWLPPFQCSAEVGRTSAAIQMRFGAETATRFEDEFSQSIQHAARVSAYPLGGLAGAIVVAASLGAASFSNPAGAE